MPVTIRCGCCGGRDLEMWAWAVLCPACDLAAADVQAPLHDRDQIGG